LCVFITPLHYVNVFAKQMRTEVGIILAGGDPGIAESQSCDQAGLAEHSYAILLSGPLHLNANQTTTVMAVAAKR
jgi:hypothetical protein